MIKQVDITQWATLDLCVRVHSARLLAPLPAGGVVKVKAIQYSQDPGDPGEDFDGADVLPIVEIDSNASGQLLVERLVPPYGNMLRFVVEGDPGTSVAGFEAELSFYLVGRSSE